MSLFRRPLALFGALCVVALLVTAASANPKSASIEDLYTGVWRDGKAILWDLEAIDIFAWYPREYQPTQPIAFDHSVHVLKNGMECQYCHSSVTKSSHSNIPSVDLCMGCHTYVMTESEEIKKLKEYHDAQEPIPWILVHHLPEHAQFNHERHIKAGVGCQNCHGQVQQMEEVRKMSGFKMGWCVSCHRENGASIDCAVCHY